MLSAVEQINTLNGYQAQPGQVSRAAANAGVQAEFMTIFYKEMLKQVFAAPRIGEDDEPSGFNTTITALNSDLMAEKMAEHLVKNALAGNQLALVAGRAEAR
jgi:Rod binding domain-containing protein